MRHGTTSGYSSGCRCDACREAKREYDRKRRESNPEHHKERNRKYREANPEAARERYRTWRAANPEKVREHQERKRTPTRMAKRRATDSKYREANRWKTRSWSHSHRAKKAGLFIEFVDLETVFVRDNWTCHVCGGAVDPALKDRDPLMASLDHIIPLSAGGPHSYENCATAHFKCNASRGNLLPRKGNRLPRN